MLDIMLGFLRSSLSTEEMIVQQRKAAKGLMKWCEGQNKGVKVTGNAAVAVDGEHLDW